ncbi:hypothetical protein ACTXK7_16060, partial [Vreelandella alkaliphila]|uniref:hypothetical protein n=1 Tax=Vreelandella alkaliphila TaxID=272774 RepID=UPI003FD8543A
ALPSPYNKAATSRSMHRTSHSNHRTVIPEPLRRHSRVGLSGIYLDLGLQQSETPIQHGFPLRACGNDEDGWPPPEACTARHAQVATRHS